MNDIASSLEQQFADVSQAERESTLSELRRIEAAGRGSVAIRPHAIALPALLGACGVLCLYAAATKVAIAWAYPVGAALLLPSLWALFARRKPCFLLTEEGVRTAGALLPWDSIADYGVTEHSHNGFTTHTSVVLLHESDYTPPPLGLFRLFGQNVRNGSSGQYETHLTLHAGARGMNCEALARRIGEFLSAFHARAELARLRAD